MNENVQELTTQELKEELKKREQAKNADRKTYKKLVQEELPKSILLLQHSSDKLSEAKTEVFSNLITLLEMKIKAYGVKSNQQSHTFSLDNGDTITAGFRITDGWDDTVTEGLAKINQFLESLISEGDADEDKKKMVSTINRLLKKDAKGNLKANRVVELRNVAEEWNRELLTDGVDIISKAYKPVKSVHFLEATVVTPSGEKKHIPLSISSVPFSTEIEINF